MNDNEYPGEFTTEGTIEGTNMPGNSNNTDAADEKDPANKSCLGCSDEERLQ